MNTNTLKRAAGFTAAMVLSAGAAYAQDPGEEDVIVLDEVAAEDIPIEESILATTRPITSVYGTERSILDTPRNVNIVSREQLDAISIKDVRDFSKLTSSSYTKTNFGAPTTPNLRGQEADLMINGIRRGHSINGNGVPINFNSVESVNIVKGPAGAVFGTSNYVGGYADLITKRAYFDNGGQVEYTYGSFEQHTLDFDANVALTDTLAFRTSVQLKEWEGFWDRWYDKSQSVYMTFAWRPNDKFRWDLMGEYYKGNYTENWGINRVTQDLLDHGLYIPNRGTDADYRQLVLVDQPPVGFGNFIGVPIEDPDNAVKIRRETKMASPGDDSNATVAWLQAIGELEVSDNLKITNNTYFHYKDRHTFSSYHYAELLPDNWSIENRLQAIQDIEVDNFESLQLNYGMRLKYQDIVSYNHFFEEPANYHDLTRDPELWRIPDSSFAPSGIEGSLVDGEEYSEPYGFVRGQTPRGVLNNWYAGQAFETESIIMSPFIQVDLKIDDKLSFLGGYTIDYLEHKEGLPGDYVSGDGDRFTVSQPTDRNNDGEITPADYVAGDFVDNVPIDYSKTETSANFYNANVSVVYKPTPDSSVYFTYNKGEHFDSNTGGAINGGAVEGLETSLTEFGTNISLFDGKAYLGAAIFQQEYTTRNQDGSIDVVETDGFEIELNYQPNRNFFATLGYSFLDSERTAGFFATASPADNPTSSIVPGFWLTPTFPAFTPGAKYETPGVPPHLLNALVQYKFDNGIGVQANLVYTSPMEVGYDGANIVARGFGATVLEAPRLDWQYEIDTKIFYEYEDWRFEFSIFNVTDEENWDLPNTGYALGSAVARPERSYEFSVRYSW